MKDEHDRTETEIIDSINRLLKAPDPEASWLGLVIRCWVILAFCGALFVWAYWYLGKPCN